MDQSHLTKTYCTGEYDRSNRKQRLHQLDQALAESEEKYFANGATASATLTRQRTPSFAIQSLGRQPQLLHQDLMPDNLGALRRTWSHHQTRSSFSEPHSVVMAQPLLDQPTATSTANVSWSCPFSSCLPDTSSPRFCRPFSLKSACNKTFRVLGKALSLPPTPLEWRSLLP
jgi:hypothetical protein